MHVDSGSNCDKTAEEGGRAIYCPKRPWEGREGKGNESGRRSRDKGTFALGASRYDVHIGGGHGKAATVR